MSWLKRKLVPILLGALAVAGLSLASAAPASAGETDPDDVSTTTLVESSDEPESTAETSTPTERRSTKSTVDLVTRSLWAIAVATGVMAIAFFWYTMPSRRLRLAEKRRSVTRRPSD